MPEDAHHRDAATGGLPSDGKLSRRTDTHHDERGSGVDAHCHVALACEAGEADADLGAFEIDTIGVGKLAGIGGSILAC
jgi:hypothetical protein